MTTYRAEIDAAAAAHSLDPLLVQAVVEQESAGRFHAYRFEPGFFSKYLAKNPMYASREPREVAASFGLMQCLYTTAVEYGYAGEPWGLFDPRVSLEFGCRVLASNLAWARGLTSDEHTALRSALGAYNGGRKRNTPAAPLQNATYADQVLARYARLKGAT